MKYRDYGDLNPLFKKRTKPNLDPDTTSFFGSSMRSALEEASPNIIENISAIKGVALYAWKETEPISGPSILGAGMAETICVKVRIPELHALPIPSALPAANDPADEDAD